VANDIAKGIMETLMQMYLRPGQRAALYELLAQTPGFTVVPGVRDAIGRVGVGIEWRFGLRDALIFDPTTYALLGERAWPPSAPYLRQCKDCTKVTPWYVWRGEALVRLAIVNRRGQVP
jgi:hypothetical protein